MTFVQQVQCRTNLITFITMYGSNNRIGYANMVIKIVLFPNLYILQGAFGHFRKLAPGQVN
jgi:hypothetical protein